MSLLLHPPMANACRSRRNWCSTRCAIDHRSHAIGDAAIPTLASADIGELPVSGVLEIGDVDSLILLLRESIGLSVEWSEKQVVVKSKWS